MRNRNKMIKGSLDIDRRIVAYITDNPGVSSSAIGVALADHYTEAYTRARVRYLGSRGVVRIDTIDKAKSRSPLTAVYPGTGLIERPPAPGSFTDGCGTLIPGFDEIYHRYRALPWLNRERCDDIYRQMLEIYQKTGYVPCPYFEPALEISGREWAFWIVAQNAIVEG